MMHKSLRVMHIVHSINCGGQEKMLITLAEHQQNNGHHVRICVLEGPGELSDEVKKKQIPVHYLHKRPGVELGLIFKLWNLLRKHKIDILHAHNMGPVFYGTIAAKLAMIPAIVVTRHDRYPLRWNAGIWYLTDAIVAISQDTLREFCRNNRVSGKKLHVIHNGIDIACAALTVEEHNALRAEFGISSDDIVVGSVGRLCPEKDYHTLIRAIKLACEQRQDIKLLIVGGGKLKGELQAYCHEIGIDNKVILAGFRNDVSKLFGIMDMYAMSSISEGMPIALLEAMANGKPTIVTDVGGMAEVIVNGVNGFIVPPQVPSLLAEKILVIASNNKCAADFCHDAKTRIMDCFGIEQMYGKYEQLYRTILNNKGYS